MNDPTARENPSSPTADHGDDGDLDRGLAFDLGRMMARRRALALLDGSGLGVVLAACGGSADTATSTTTTTEGATEGSTSTEGGGPGGLRGGPGGGGGPGGAPPSGSSSGSGDPDAIPEETAGPYPGDGSNGPDVLLQDGVVRSDITSSFGTGSGTADGVPLTVTFTVTDTDGNPLAGRAVYAWHCDAAGRYSLYSSGLEDENYLRGVQETTADGRATFTTIVPGCYSGRWPHVHFEVYESLDVATSSGDIVATSQLALPQDVCDAAYATSGYEGSVPNLANITLETDNVFSDGADRQLATVTGSVSRGYVATLGVPVA